MSARIAFYVDAGRETGFGHLFRSASVARWLRLLGADVALFIPTFDAAVFAQDRFGLSVYYADPDRFAPPEADAWVVDLEGGCPPSIAQRLRPRCSVLALINGTGYQGDDPARSLADLVFYQGVTDVPKRLDWSGTSCRWYEGLSWIALRPEVLAGRVLRAQTVAQAYRALGTVLVAGGGSDPTGFVPRAASALRARYGDGLRILAIIGPRAAYGADALPPGTEAVAAPDNPVPHYLEADAAVVSFGMTAYELAALGIPTVAFGMSPGHCDGAELLWLSMPEFVQSAGPTNVDDAELSYRIDAALEWLVSGPRFARVVPEQPDGLGAARTATEILAALEE